MKSLSKSSSNRTCGIGFFLAGVALLLCLVPASGQVPGGLKPRIDPAGIDGSLLLCGKDGPAEAVQRFVTLAGGKEKAKITVLYSTTIDNPLPKLEFFNQLKKELGEDWVDRMHSYGIIKPELFDDAEVKKKLESSTGIWLHSESSANSTLSSNKPLREAMAKVLKNGGVVSGSNGGAALLAEQQLHPFSANGMYGGLGLLPDSFVGFPPIKGEGNLTVGKLMSWNPGKVGYEIEHDAALLIQGRKMQSLGEGKVTIHLAACTFKPAKQIALQGKKGIADLTALRNAALARTQPEFPPKKMDPPEVKNGTLIIVGGGGMPKGLTQKFVEMAGGDKAIIVVLPTAVPDPLPPKDSMAEAFKKLGAKKVTYLKARKLHEVESKETLDILAEATGIWFGGGRQWGFVDAYLGTKAEKIMHEVLAKGGVIGGSSAGASIQGEYMPRGDPLGNLNIIAEGYEKGLGFLKGVAIDQHFTQRKRHADMTLLMKTYPQLLGIGLDEATAIIVKGQTADVTGNGKVFFYDPKLPVVPGQPDFEAVAHGGRYDLKARKVLDKGLAHPK